MTAVLFKPGGSGSGGGGGTSLRWYYGDTNAPIKSVLSNGLEVLAFDSTDEQEMFATLKVPSTYSAGVQIKLVNGNFYSASTSGNALFRCETRIFKANIDATSTPTAHTSTNTEQAVDGTTNEIVIISDIDLTNASGQINSVSVSAGDTLLIKLFRDVSAETSSVATASLVLDGFEPKFT